MPDYLDSGSLAPSPQEKWSQSLQAPPHSKDSPWSIVHMVGMEGAKMNVALIGTILVYSDTRVPLNFYTKWSLTGHCCRWMNYEFLWQLAIVYKVIVPTVTWSHKIDLVSHARVTWYNRWAGRPGAGASTQCSTTPPLLPLYTAVTRRCKLVGRGINPLQLQRF